MNKEFTAKFNISVMQQMHETRAFLRQNSLTYVIKLDIITEFF